MTMGGPALSLRLGMVSYLDQTPFARAMVLAEKQLLNAIHDFGAGKNAAANRQVATARELLAVAVPDLQIHQAPTMARRLGVPIGGYYEAKAAKDLLAHVQRHGSSGAVRHDAEQAIMGVRFAGHSAIDRLPGAEPVQLSIIGTVIDEAKAAAVAG